MRRAPVVEKLHVQEGAEQHFGVSAPRIVIEGPSGTEALPRRRRGPEPYRSGAEPVPRIVIEGLSGTEAAPRIVIKGPSRAEVAPVAFIWGPKTLAKPVSPRRASPV